ncbi:MAG: DegT/DnrJ/EryC1/StrS family aminotransferase, partial [Acidimicrobiia bacterium]|nr:DegT/DnrJ/EryC1/StrS family aminotransferase [Acidimicrobiia bacterium]NNJ46722.1 DegT/DnrJ/EryC1/StrS family aminotransferase [Acidimicrobiia bacterium]
MSTLPSDQNASGRDLGTDELALLKSVIESGTLTSTKGETVKNLELEFAQMLGSPHAVACSSGSAAVHIAVAALDLEPGDEVITTPVTDMGALAPILFQGLIPVFADTDPATLNVTAETIAARITARTRAIIVTHLFGCPADMGPIMDLAARHGLPVIEDAAQAFLAESQGAMVGTVGAIGCFSFQQGKHMTSGEGGIVVTADPALARRMRLFVNKAWGYGDPAPDHYFLALNYRLTELQGAVALAQLRKLPSAVKRRRAMAERLTSRISGLDGLELPSAPDGGDHSYWRYPHPQRIP